MLKSILISGAVAVLFGCGGAPVDAANGILYDPCEPIVVVPSDTTTAEQRASIAAAIAMWRDVGVGSLTLDPEGGQQRVPVGFKKTVVLFRGVYSPSNGEVEVNSALASRVLDITIAHELGHAIGLPHVPKTERASLMNPGNGTVPPTAEDERQLRMIWSCLSPP